MVAFGTSGLRGLSRDLVSGPARAHVAAFARHLLEAGLVRPGDRVFIGRDRRDSSPEIAAQGGAALASMHLRPVDCGILPTPALAAYAMARGAACIMVTGSHIPADRNGLKFYRPDGEIDKQDETAIADRAGNSVPAGPVPYAMESDDGAALAAFEARGRALFDAGALRGLRVGVYEHSSVASGLLTRLLLSLGSEVVSLAPSETFVPIDTEAVDTDLKARLAGWTRAHRLDAIVSTDGDGDRPLVTDERGAQVRGDVLGVLTARRLGAGTIVTPVTSNAGIEAAGGARVVRTRVGSPYVLAAMRDAAADGPQPVVGFEANGGFLVGSPATMDGRPLEALPTRDSILPILATLSTRAASGAALSEIVAGLGLPESASGRLENVAPERSARFMGWLRHSPRHVAALLEGIGRVELVKDVDGLQIFMPGGEVMHYRPSGNAPEMRCYAQAPSAQRAAMLVEAGLERLKRFDAEGPDAFPVPG